MKKEIPSRLALEFGIAFIAFHQGVEWCMDKLDLVLLLLSMAFYYRCTYDAIVERPLPSQAWKMGVHPHCRDT